MISVDYKCTIRLNNNAKVVRHYVISGNSLAACHADRDLASEELLLEFPNSTISWLEQ